MILDELKKKLVEYMKSGDSERMSALRYFLSQVQNKEIELRPSKTAMTDEIAFKVLKKQVKDRKELIDIYTKSGNSDKVAKETKELDILKEFAKFFPFDLDAVPQRPQQV